MHSTASPGRGHRHGTSWRGTNAARIRHEDGTDTAMQARHGQNYVPSEAPQTSPAKRFKGALDMIWTSFRIDQEADSRAASAAGGTVPPAPVDGQPPPGGTPPGPLQASSAGVAPGPVAGVAQPARAHRNREASHVIFEGFRPRADAQARAHRNTEASHVIFRWLVRRFGCQPRLAASPH